MGGTTSTQGACLEQTLAPSQTQCEQLEAELLQLGAKKTLELPNVIEDADGADLPSTGGWEIYYDNAELALTRRFWWLREHGGVWTLRAPTAEVPHEACADQGAYQEVRDVGKILECLGLVTHKEAWMRGVLNAPQVFAQAGLLPFARLHVERTIFQFAQAEGAGVAQDGESVPSQESSLNGHNVTTIFEEIRFDVKFAENETVADALFEHGNAAKDKFRCTLVRVKMPVLATDEDGQATARLASLLVARGLDSCAAPGCSGASPILVAYLRQCRPAHWSLLRSLAGATAEEAVEAGPESVD